MTALEHDDDTVTVTLQVTLDVATHGSAVAGKPVADIGPDLAALLADFLADPAAHLPAYLALRVVEAEAADTRTDLPT